MSTFSVAMIGANGRIGAELCSISRNDDEIEVIPVVRNMLASSFLTYLGFCCRVLDISEVGDAKQAMSDVDAVVIAAYERGGAKWATDKNKLLIENSVKYSKPSAKIIYFSTIRALGRALDKDAPRFSLPSRYVLRKRLCERFLLRLCRKYNKRGYALRLGHVFGELQPRTVALRALLSTSQSLRLLVAADRPSNVLHTVTINDAVKICVGTELSPGVYCVVNNPQWTWHEVFDYYNSNGIDLMFEGSDGIARSSGSHEFVRGLRNQVSSKRDRLEGFLMYMPKNLEQRLKMKQWVRQYKAIAMTDRRPPPVFMREFQHSPVTVKLVPGLRETRALFHQHDSCEDVCSPAPCPTNRNL